MAAADAMDFDMDDETAQLEAEAAKLQAVRS